MCATVQSTSHRMSAKTNSLTPFCPELDWLAHSSLEEEVLPAVAPVAPAPWQRSTQFAKQSSSTCLCSLFLFFLQSSLFGVPFLLNCVSANIFPACVCLSLECLPPVMTAAASSCSFLRHLDAHYSSDKFSFSFPDFLLLDFSCHL